ncbi:MAG: hypothetical protein ACUVXJ_18760 [Phycisphaerae bacterium]
MNWRVEAADSRAVAKFLEAGIDAEPSRGMLTRDGVMSELRKKAKRAQLRLWLNRWFSKIGWSLAGGATLFVLLVLVDRLWLVRPDAEMLTGWVCLGLLAASVVASVVWTVVTRETLSVAAATLDDAAGLRERISSAIYCEKMDDPFGQAVVADANRVTHGLTVSRHLPLRFPQSAAYAGASLLFALLVFWLFPVVDLAGKQEALQKQLEQQKRVERTAALVQPLIDKQVEALRKRYPALEQEMQQLAALKNVQAATRPEDVAKEPIKQVNNLAREIENKKENPDLAKIEEFQKIAQKLEARQRGDSAVSKLVQAMAQGDYKSAQQALEEMKLDLMKAPKADEDKQKAEELRNQIHKLGDQLKELAENDKKLQQELAKTGMKPDEIARALEHLKKQDLDALKEQLKKQGLSEKDIQKLANQLKKCQGGCQMASKLGDSLKQAAQGQQGQQGSGQGSEAGFTEAADQLSEMEALQQEMNQLTAAAADLQQMQDQLSQAGQCGGMGLGEGQLKESQGGMGSLGQGRGNIAPKTETGAKTTAQKAKVESHPGAIISTQFVHGEQIAGQVTEEYVEAVISKEREVSDAINREAIPRQYHKSVSKYFSHAREGLPADRVKAVENKFESEKPAEEAK